MITKELLYKMIIIYNALLNGWIIKMIKPNKFEFKKSKKSNTNLNLNKFIKNNLIINKF